MVKSQKFIAAMLIAYLIFILLSFCTEFNFGINTFLNFKSFIIKLFTILPFALIIIGLLDVWSNKETVQKHLGKNAGLSGYLWAILLGGTIIGPVVSAYPAAKILSDKGARLSIVITFLGSATICRIPMTIFEASYLGLKVTLIRYTVSLPLVVLTSILIEKFINRKTFSTINN